METQQRPRKAGWALLKSYLDSVRILNSLRAHRAIGVRTRKKMALLIGINYEDNEFEEHRLKGPQRDVESVKRLLIDHLHFPEDNITVLSDKGTTDHFQFIPTKENILRELESKFVNKEDTDTDYFFVYSGHSSQRKEIVPEGKRPVEADGQEEYIIPSDALESDKVFTVDEDKVISDKKLNELLVKRLGKGSQLFALFDSCHSGTLLNLKHHRCNRSGDLLSLIQDTARRVLIEPLYPRLSQQNAPVAGRTSTLRKSKTQVYRPNAPTTGETPTVGKSATWMSTASHESTIVPWWGKRWCTGFCPRIPLLDKPQVVCISACKDSQVAIESSQGGMIIPAIVALLEKNHAPTYREVMFAARSGVEATRKGVAGRFNGDMKNKKCQRHFNHLWQWHQRCLTSQEQSLKEMINLKCDPQLSSRKPLNTNNKLRI